MRAWSVVCVPAFVIAASLGIRGDRPAVACGFFGPTFEEQTTFDPSIVEAWDGLYYNPSMHGYGGACTDCATEAVLADWRGYLGDVSEAEWKALLFEHGPGDVAELVRYFSGKAAAPPKGFERLAKVSAAARDKLAAAVALIDLARGLEPLASFAHYDPSGNERPTASPPAAMLTAAKAGLASAKDAFLQQRYAFQVLRVLFYQRDWPAAIAFFDRTPALAGPSQDLAWRARYYVAGALVRARNRARANLELARIHAGYGPLSGAAAEDFKPKEEGDWHESLRLARDARDKAALWRLVGIKQDGVVALQELVKLDPKSTLIALLAVRELTRAEVLAAGSFGAPPDPKDVAAQSRELATLEKLVQQVAATPGADRPWLMELVLGHIAAKRGDLAGAKSHLQRALAGKPGDVRVASQARASLAIAIAANWRTGRDEDELARAMNAIDPKFARLTAVRTGVRDTLAKAYVKAGKLVDAEMLTAGSAPAAKWSEVAFIKEMIARRDRTATEFDRFVVTGAPAKAQLEQELALRYLVSGDFTNASQTFRSTGATSELLHTDPFVIHTIDCHDCDHEKFDKASWTHASFAARLVDLEHAAVRPGEPGAEASLALGNAMYNITWYGNARVVLETSHQGTRDAHAAERWYKRAFELTANRELKAKAAFLAAKAELGNLIAAAQRDDGQTTDVLPIPKTWYPIVKSFADTRYYKEVLAECGHFRAWARTAR
jgi:hypothetical protein